MNTIALKPLDSPTNAVVEIPGSKSVTNRALIMGALTKNPVKISFPLWSDDIEAMVGCLNTLGIKTIHCKDSIHVTGNIDHVKNNKFDINAHYSGTTMRFILALCCLVPGTKNIYGESGLNKRPISDLINALHLLGADIHYLQNEGYPPVIMKQSKLHDGLIEMRADISSQFVSALLMIGPYIGKIQIALLSPQISKSYIDLTIEMMKDWGILVENKNYTSYKIDSNQKYKMEEYKVEGDFSSAGYFAAIAALTRSKITIKNLNPNSTQGDRQFFDVLKRMGNEINFGRNEVEIIGKEIQSVEIDMEVCPDQVQTLAVLAAFSKGKTVISGVRSLRIKETERVKALQTELRKMRIRTESPNNNILIVYGGNPKAATIDTYNDHRMAMSFAVAGSKLEHMKINNPLVVKKTFPDFWEKLKNIGIGVTKI